MKKSREGLHSTWKAKSFYALRKEGPYARPLVGRIPTLGKLKIPPHPLLHKRRKKRACQAQGEAEEPQYVHANGRCRRPEGLVG